MPISFGSVAAQRQEEVSIDFGEETAKVWFWPHKITPRMMQEVQANSADIGTVTRTVAAIVARWEVTGNAPVSYLDSYKDVWTRSEKQVSGRDEDNLFLAIASHVARQVAPCPAVEADDVANFLAEQIVSHYDEIEKDTLHRAMPEIEPEKDSADPAMYPLTQHALSYLPLEFLTAVIEAVFTKSGNTKSKRKGGR